MAAGCWQAPTPPLGLHSLDTSNWTQSSSGTVARVGTSPHGTPATLLHSETALTDQEGATFVAVPSTMATTLPLASTPQTGLKYLGTLFGERQTRV